MIRRIPQKKQLDLFEGAVLYLSQSDAARHFGVTTRMIQYWEAQGLLNPELEAEGRSRKYTNFDLVELKFIKTMVVDCGFSVPSLKEKTQVHYKRPTITIRRTPFGTSAMNRGSLGLPSLWNN